MLLLVFAISPYKGLTRPTAQLAVADEASTIEVFCKALCLPKVGTPS